MLDNKNYLNSNKLNKVSGGTEDEVETINVQAFKDCLASMDHKTLSNFLTNISINKGYISPMLAKQALILILSGNGMNITQEIVDSINNLENRAEVINYLKEKIGNDIFQKN